MGARSDSGARTVDIKLSGDDRFLTLIVTDSDKKIADDFAVFAEPVLVFE